MSEGQPAKSQKIARVLTIAGSDPSGGAGIQADIKTISALGGYAASAITALTVQNTEGVTDILPIAGGFVKAQMIAVLNDIGADIIKIGMLGNQEIMQSVLGVLQKYSIIPVILDPVMSASSGDGLMDENAIAFLKGEVIPSVDLVTPNIPEAYQLTGVDIKSLSDMALSGSKLLEMGAGAALIKGGHMEGDALTNLLVTHERQYEFTSKRLSTSNTHGTGCTLASALATFLAQGYSLKNAVEMAGNFVHKAILTAPNLGKGIGPLGH